MSLTPGHLYTCARPGRSKDADRDVPDELVRRWVCGLPGGLDIVIISLLGRKPDGQSEFSFYSFYGFWDSPEERHGRLSFQEWLDRRHKERPIQVIEHPTHDFRPVPPKTLAAVALVIFELLGVGRTVVLIDSGGETRTKSVCSYMGFVEDFSQKV